MAYDSFRHVTLLFGGASQTGFYNDTWAYDGNDWMQVTTAHSPPARRGLGLAFDSARGRTVLFGGQDPSFSDLNDTWEFDGTDWIQVATTTSPTARLWHSMAYDPNLGGVVMLGGAAYGTNYSSQGDSWLYDGSSWQQLAAANPWSARLWASADYDSAHGDVLMFGGSTTPLAAGGQFFSDTWALQGVTTSAPDWTQANPSLAPSARVFSQMDYDSARGVSVLFGGSSDSGPGNLSDTWEWDGFKWVQMTPAVSPPPVADGVMAYDSRRGMSVLFGGSGLGGLSSATWEWDGAGWTQRSFAVSPAAQVWAAMAYDSIRNRMVLFEGDPNSGSPAQTWQYDGSAWTLLHPTSSPSARRGPAMAFDPILGRVVLFGGEDSTGRLADTWEWDGANWTLVTTASAPHARFWATMAFDSQRGRTILFGGDHIQPYSLGESNDTWEWDGSQWTRDWTAAAPAIRSGHAMAYDSNRGRLVVFGGWNAATSPATIYGDTSELGNGIVTAAGSPGVALDGYGYGTNFGSVNVGSTSPGDAAFGLSSTGTGPARVGSITLTGDSDFAMTTDCPVSANPLPAGSSCVTLVSFTPTVAGSRTASITFTYNAPAASQTFQLTGTGVLMATTLSVSPVVAVYNYAYATLSATLQSNGSPVAGQTISFQLPQGFSGSAQTDSAGYAQLYFAPIAGIHAGTYTTGIQATFAGSPGYSPSSGSAPLTISQPVATAYAGSFYVADTTSAKVAVTVDQRTPASDKQFFDYSSSAVWARFTVVGPAMTSDFYGRVTDATDWATSGLGTANATLPALSDGAYTVVVSLVDGSGSINASPAVASGDVRVGLVSSPVKGGYLSGGGAIASDPSANTSDTHGYFSVQMKPGSAPQGNFVYVYRTRMDVGGGNLRDVDVWVTSTDVTSLAGNSSTATATGHFSVQYVDAQTGQRYTTFEFTGGTFKLAATNATNKASAAFGLVLKRADGTVFHTTGSSATSPVVLGSLVSSL
jgi:hypothetical protein